MKNEQEIAYETDFGVAYRCSVEDFLDSNSARDLEGKVQLIFTSPPFPLQTQKGYGNKTDNEYVEWLSDLAPSLAKLLAPDGSIVVEIGNSWVKGKPVMSMVPLRTLMEFLARGSLELCQQFVCHNPARLPSPIEWVNKRRIRVKDSYTNLWWMSPSENPKANNANVLTEYSQSMRRLLDTGSYNPGIRPSEHLIGEESFARDNGGAIPPNVLQFSNTSSSSPYRTYCKSEGIKPHPAVMSEKLPAWFIRFLTDVGDTVLDPFAGSNTTGAAAERLGRRWVAIERDNDDNGRPLNYLEGSLGRFTASDQASFDFES